MARCAPHFVAVSSRGVAARAGRGTSGPSRLASSGRDRAPLALSVRQGADWSIGRPWRTERARPAPGSTAFAAPCAASSGELCSPGDASREGACGSLRQSAPCTDDREGPQVPRPARAARPREDTAGRRPRSVVRKTRRVFRQCGKSKISRLRPESGGFWQHHERASLSRTTASPGAVERREGFRGRCVEFKANSSNYSIRPLY